MKTKKIILIIFLAALTLRLFFFFAMFSDYGRGSFYLDNGQGLDNNDSQHYVVIAKNIVEHHSYSRFFDPPFQLDGYRTPLLPAYFVPFIWLLGFDSTWMAILILIFVLSLIPVVSYFLAKLFISERKSFWVGILVALEPLLAYRSNFAEPDILMMLLFLISVYFLIIFWRNLKIKDLVGAAVFLGLLTLAKPAGVYILIFFLAFILSKLFFNKDKWKKIIFSAIICCAVFLAMVLPWLYRNYRVFGVWDLSSITAHNLYSYYTAEFKLPNEKIYFSPDDRDPVRNLKYQNQLIAISFQRIKNQPVKYWTSHLMGTFRSLSASDLPSFYYNGHGKLLPFKYNPINNINITGSVINGDFATAGKFIFHSSNWFLILRYLVFFIFYALILLAWFKSFKNDKKRFAAFTLFLIIAFYFVFTPGPFVDPKYRLPVIPLLLIIFFYFFEKKKKDNRKIVIAADIFPPDIGGPATYSFKMANELQARDWQVKLLCYSDKKENDKYSFSIYRIIRGRLPAWRYVKYFLKLILISWNADVIYAMGPVSAGWPSSLAARLLNKKFAVKVVGDYAWEQARNTGATKLEIDDFQKEKLSGKILKLKNIERAVCLKADKIITPSEYLKKIVIGWGVPAERIQVIYNAFDITNLDNRELVDNNLIISVGRLVSWKGFDVLIGIMPDLLAKNKNFQLQIIGTGPEKEKLINLVKESNLQKSVLIEEINHREVLSKLSLAGVFVLNTGYEGLSHAILEAMGASVPVITTNVGGNTELIQDGYNGLLVKYNDHDQLKMAILKLHDNKELREKFIINSNEVLKKFTFNSIISQTDSFLNNL